MKCNRLNGNFGSVKNLMGLFRVKQFSEEMDNNERYQCRNWDAVEKYSSNGGFSPETFGDLELPQMVVGPLAEAGNFSVAAAMWASYATAEHHISRVDKATGVEFFLLT